MFQASAHATRLGLLGRWAQTPLPPGARAGSRSGRRPPGDEFRVGLCVPLQGSDGIWGPSCIASARLAHDEINQVQGMAGRPCTLRIIDASESALDVGGDIATLVRTGEVDALVGMCISSVRERIAASLKGRVPFVYTPLYEGGPMPPGIFAIGETAERQLLPSIAWLSRLHGARRWALIGNDYIWPRVSHQIARQAVVGQGGKVVAERFVPFGFSDFDALIDQLRSAQVDAVLLTMIGQDAVDFNRAFGRAGLSCRMVRLSCAIEENQLLAIGAGNTDRLFVALGYFDALQTDANLAFKERYRARFGDRAPVINSIGQSLYEGMHYLAALLERKADGAGQCHRSARGAAGGNVGRELAPIYLAEAEGHAFRVVTRL